MKAFFVIIASVYIMELVKAKNVIARKIGKGSTVKNENAKMVAQGMRLEYVSVQMCSKVNFVKLVDVKTEEDAWKNTRNANVP
jgi:hypothetical protein